MVPLAPSMALKQQTMNTTIRSRGPGGISKNFDRQGVPRRARRRKWLKRRETLARKKIMGRKSAKPSLHLVPPTGMLGNTPPRTLAEHGGSLWNRVMTDYQIEDVAGRELLALACQQLDRAE